MDDTMPCIFRMLFCRIVLQEGRTKTGGGEDRIIVLGGVVVVVVVVLVKGVVIDGSILTRLISFVTSATVAVKPVISHFGARFYERMDEDWSTKERGWL